MQHDQPMTGIVLIPLVPVRTAPAETAEMCTQLLFGERVELLEVQERWIRIRNMTDQYEGWADRKMIHPLNEQEAGTLDQAQWKHVQIPACSCALNGTPVLLPGGSLIPFMNTVPCMPAGQTLLIDDTWVDEQPADTGRIVHLAQQYRQAPYLWGGKSVMGIDCSGFVQVVFAMCGIVLPRDASLQAGHGESIEGLDQAQAGDLAFFENAQGRIVHVGILLGPDRIIHASGQVKTERIDRQGIISAQTGMYTHRLSHIQRFMNRRP